jgi:hypothetical protein
LTFDELRVRFVWRPLRGCPGRLVLPAREEDAARLAPGELASGGSAAASAGRSFRAPGAVDEVWIVELEGGGGLLSYRKPDGRFVHTLNTSEGLARKLAALGLEPRQA